MKKTPVTILFALLFSCGTPTESVQDNQKNQSSTPGIITEFLDTPGLSKIEIRNASDQLVSSGYRLNGKKESSWIEFSPASGMIKSSSSTKSFRGAQTKVMASKWPASPASLAPSSIERNGKDVSQFEVVATDAVVEVPAGTFEKCLAVLETSPSGGVLTHFWAPNVGKVAVKSNDEFVLKLVSFDPGRRANGD